MSENKDSQVANLCLTEDAFDRFQAVSMYQEEEYITLPVPVSAKPKEPDPGELSHPSYGNEVVITTENEVNSTEEIEQETENNSYLETTGSLDGAENEIDHDYAQQNVTRRGRKKKHVIENDTETVGNNMTIRGAKESSDTQRNSEQESSVISSTVPRRRGRKPKPKSVPTEPVISLETNQDSLNISSSRLSSDPETSDIAASVKRKRGRPRKSIQNGQNDSNKDISSEMSGSDSNIIDNVLLPRKRGRPRKTQSVDLLNKITNDTEVLSNDLISIEDLNGTQSTNTLERSKELIDLDISKIENRDLDKKIFSDSDNDGTDDITLSKLKMNPETLEPTAENNLTENGKDQNLTNSKSEFTVSHPSKKRNLVKKGRGRKPKKVPAKIAEKDKIEMIETTDSLEVSSVSKNETNLESSCIDSDDNENLTLSQLKEAKSDLANAENNDTNVVSTTTANETVETKSDIIKTPTKRNIKMPVMSDFEYNVDSVLEKEDTGNEADVDNALLIEDTSKRPIRRKVAKLHYDEESDEDPFANVELSDDDEPRKGKRYYSDDEYVPGRRGNKDIESTDSEIDLKNETHTKKKKLRKKSDCQSPQKKGKQDQTILDVESDDVEECLQTTTVVKPTDNDKPKTSNAWDCSNEFENFLAKKIQGTNLKIKKVSASAPTENKTLEIPVLDQGAKKTYEMCSQTNIIQTTNIGVQTTTPYDVPMKKNIALTAEQSEKACHFLNSIVTTTSELGTLMSQKSEDFIKKKINTTHVTDTMKMDYCVKKSFLLFKLAKTNLMQMEEDLAKQYDEFLKNNNLTACRELPKQIEASAKPASSDSDCEIVEEPTKPTSVNKSKGKPKFNPKTVFLNKELSIKIAKKPSETNKKLDIKGRHTVWINDTVMVKKVPQSFLAQDSRNKKPPDNNITTKMVSDFFKNYYHQKAISLCAPFITTDWINVNKECVCNYFVVKPVLFNNNDINYSANERISTDNNASTSETNHAIIQIPNKTILTCPETLLKLCFRIVKNQVHDKRFVKKVCHQHIQNELTDGKDQPMTLLRQCLRFLTSKADKTVERSPTPSKTITPKDVSNVPPLKMLCHQRIVELLSSSGKNDSRNEQELAETRSSTEESNNLLSTCSSTYPSSLIKITEIKSLLSLCVELIQSKQDNSHQRMVPLLSNSGIKDHRKDEVADISCNTHISNSIKIKEIKSLLSLCVDFLQKIQVIESGYITSTLKPKSLKSSAFECVKKLINGDVDDTLLQTSRFNLSNHNHGNMIEGLTINCVNTLSEEAFLNLEHSQVDNPDSSDEYLDDFDNDGHYEPVFDNEIEEENPPEPETSWVSQVQVQEFRSCFNTTNTDVNEEKMISVVTRIKLEPEDDLPDSLDTLAHVKTEPIHGLNEMTIIPAVKPEAIDVLGSAPLEHLGQSSNSYDVDAFEQFASSNKILQEFRNDDIFSQSSHRVRRQHEPDYEEDDMSMSLLVPQTFEPLTIETAKGRLMESSSDDGSAKNKKVTGKKKPDKRKSKQKKVDPKTINKETPTLASKDTPTNIEVATLTKKMRSRIRQEEKKDDSSDSESENLPLRLRTRKEQEKLKLVQASKSKKSEIQCNNVDSTDQTDDVVNEFTGFTAIDQNEISNYQKYMQYVYSKIIPDKENDCGQINNKIEEVKGTHEEPVISNEPAELLECEPTMPIFDDSVGSKRNTRRSKGNIEISKKEEELSKKKEEELSRKKEEELSRKKEKELSRKKEVELSRKKEEELSRKKEEELSRKKEEELSRKKEEELSRKKEEKLSRMKEEELSKKKEEAISKKEETLKTGISVKKEELSSKKEEKLSRMKEEELSKKKEEPISKKEETLKTGIFVKKEVLKETSSFVDRHGWHCYPVDGADEKLYQSSCVALEKLPESFVQTYFEYQGITNKNVDDQEIDRLTNLNSLNRTVQVNSSKVKLKSKREAKGDHTSGADSRAESPIYSDHYDELEPSEDEGANVDDEVAPPVPLKHTENTLAKNLLMADHESDSDSGVKVKKEPSDDSEKTKLSNTSKKKVKAEVEDGADLMLTADKMMNKELNLLHAPVVVTDDAQSTPMKGPVTRNKQKSAAKNQPSTSQTKNEEDSSSEEEKQWVSTKEKLLKRMGKKDQTSLDDAKRAKLVSEFIEKRGGRPDSHIRPRSTRTRRSGKRFLERQKQLRVLSRELFGESSEAGMSKRSQASLYRGRRNIRKVIDKKSLARSTVVANMEEFERKRRLNAKQAKLRELLGCEEGVNVLVINDEVCLEYDFEENRPVVTVHPFFTKVMKAHQYEGVKFMWDACFESLAELAAGKPGGGCILAHCMGLGKTLQVLALLHTVLTHPGVNMQRVLVCCPLSTVLNWVDEIHKWIGPVTNQIKVFELSKLKKTYERAYQLEDWYNGGGIFIIGYELFRSLSTLDPFLDDVRPTIVNKIRTALLDPGPDIIVCDEGHLLKNDCSVLAVAMSRVVTKRRIILTGTPMQNNLREYYCMVNFVKPNLLGTYSEYSNRFENPIMNGQHRDSLEEDIKLMKARTHILHKVLEGCLQRQEASVLYPYLPKKHEYTVFITLTPCQWDLYKHYLRFYGNKTKQSILKDFHILQKIWSHPQVLHNFQTKVRDREEKNKIKAEKLEDDLATEDLEEIKPNAAEDLWWLEYLDGGNMLETLDSSNKFVVVFRILDECVALGDKVLIFSTSLFCLDALEYFLKKINKWSLGHEYYRLDGSVPAEVRQKWCREFNADNNHKTKLFLVSTRAGCLGLNMTAANRVIIMDTSWNPAHDIQSIFRVYRFGQKKDCYIYRLVAMGTMEQKIYERSVTKQAVACRVVDEQQIDRHYNMAELTELYKYDEGGSCVAGGVAVGVHDVALLRVARDVLLHAVHEHDSLLRDSSEQGLPEHERNAAWMQFQQEQAHKQMENKLTVKPPRVALKRVHDNASASASATVVKEEDTSDYNPSEPKTKKGRKSSIIKCCIPIQDTEKLETRSGSRKEASIIKPGTSKQYMDSVASTSSANQNSRADINKEDAMVEAITNILIKYDYQNKRDYREIGNLVKKVRSIIKRGYFIEEDMSDDATASIAKVLLSQHLSIPMVNTIMSESISNSEEPSAETGAADTELITSDPTPSMSYKSQRKSDGPEGQRTKRKAAIAAEKSIDSLAQEVVINLDDDDFDARDTDFVPDEGVAKPKKKSKNLSPSKITDIDESTMSADESRDIMSNVDSLKTNGNPSITNENTNIPKKSGPKKPKDRIIKSYTRQPNKDSPELPSKPIDDEPIASVSIPPEKDNSSILLSDDDGVMLSRATAEKLAYRPKKVPEKPPESDPSSDEVVPLPMNLLKNQNFINIVAHTYLVGNPMLDEDAATLAAQYSTLKAYKEAEQTGKPVCSGPVYDIAVKVIGKDMLKKMHSANPKAAGSSVVDDVASIQMKEQMIQTQKTFEETAAKSSKTKSIKLREDIIQQQFATNESKTAADKPKAAEVKAVATPSAVSLNSTVVPVGLIKTVTRIGAHPEYGIPELKSERVVSRVECILPDDDDVIISDLRVSSPAPSPLLPLSPPPLMTTNKPIIVKNIDKSIKSSTVTPRGVDVQQGFRVTVGNGNGPHVSTPKLVTQPKILIRRNAPSVQTPKLLTITAATATPTVVQASAAMPVVPERIVPNDGTICLDSDEEESIPPSMPATTTSTAPYQAPVPVSLTSAQNPGIKLPLPPMQGLLHHSAPAHNFQSTTPQKLVLRQVKSSSGTQPQYVLIPSDQLPLPTSSATEPPKITCAEPKIVSVNSFNTAPSEPISPAIIPESSPASNRTACKPGDILRITKSGAIEVITRAALQPTPDQPATNSLDTNNIAIQNPKPTTPQKLPEEPKRKTTASITFKKILPKPPEEPNRKTTANNTFKKVLNEFLNKPSAYETLIPTTPEVTKSKLTVPKSSNSSTVDLTNVSPVDAKQKAIAPKPSTTATYDLTDTNDAVSKKTTPRITEKNRTEKKVPARKSQQISNASSTSTRPASPENPLSILKDVVHIKAVDYPEKSVTLTSEKSKTSNISVQHVVSSDLKNKTSDEKKELKLTKIPKALVPKHINEAVEKQIKKDALMKRITPLLSKNQQQTNEGSKNRGRNSISFDNLTSAQSSKILKNSEIGNPTDKKGKSVSKATETVDLTNIGATFNPKIDSKKRQSSTEVTQVKKKKPEPMTLKDFDLDDIDDIIELD